MTRIHLVAEGTDVRGLEWNLRDDGDAVIALLPVQRDVLVAEPLEALQRKGVVDALGLLEAQHVRPRALEKLRDQIDAQPHRIDVPGCQGKTHENCVLASSRRVGKGAKRRAHRLFWVWIENGGHASPCPPYGN